MQENRIHKLKFAASGMSREYGSNIYFSKGEKTDRLQFRTKVVYAGIFMRKYYIFHLYKYDIFINGTAPDDHSYRLANECNKSFYPLITFYSPKEGLVGMRNDVVRQRWQQHKPNIVREFIGKPAEDYIKETEKNIYDDNKALDLIQKDWFFNSFFSLKYGYPTDIELPIERKFPIVSFKEPLVAKGIQKSVFEDDGIHVVQQGEFIDDRFFNYGEVKNAFDTESGKIRGNYLIDYRLDDHCIIDSIQATFSFFKENGDPLSDIRIESYYLNECPLQAITDDDTIALGEQIELENKDIEKAKKKQKSLWEQFNDYLNSPI